MICAADEIGVGDDHAGIIVLPADARVGMPAAEYYHVESDHVLEVDITPNRVDATSHYGLIVTIYVNPLRYTSEYLLKNDGFIVSFFEEKYRRDLLTKDAGFEVPWASGSDVESLKR